MSDWMGVTVSGTPQRVTSLNLADLGLDGELSGLLGNLTGLTTLNLSGNRPDGHAPVEAGAAEPDVGHAVGTRPSRAARRPGWTRRAASPHAKRRRTRGRSRGETRLPAGTYEFDPGTDEPTVVFDVPEDSGLLYQGARLIYPQPGRWKNSTSMMIFANAEQTAWISVDLGWVRPGSLSFTDGFTSTGTESGHSRADFEAIYKQISESIWERVD